MQLTEKIVPFPTLFQYATVEEQQKRATIFHASSRFVNAGNRRGLSYNMRTNHLADWTAEERRSLKGRSQTAVYITLD